MKISTLSLLAGCVAAAPLMAKAPAKTSPHAASSHAKAAAAKKALAHKGARPAAKTAAKTAKPASSTRTTPAEEKLVPTVSFNGQGSAKPAGVAAAQPAGHTKEQMKPSGVSDPAPGVPVDFGTASEAKGYQGDIDSSVTDIQNLLARAYGRKPGKTKTGLAAVMALQPQVDKALGDDQVSEEDRQNLKSLLAQRDTALYMLSASLIAQKKDAAAASYLRFLAKSASPGTPMRDAAVQQLAQIGLTP